MRKDKLTQGIKKKWADPKYHAQMSEKAKIDILHAQKGWRKKYDEDPKFRQDVFDRCIEAYEKNKEFSNVYIYKNNIMKSSYEVNFAKFLDKHDIIWEYEPKKFFYHKNGQNRCYIPDFFVPALNTFFEIKAEWWINEETEERLHLVERRDRPIVLIKEDNWDISLDKILCDYKLATCSEHNVNH